MYESHNLYIDSDDIFARKHLSAHTPELKKIEAGELIIIEYINNNHYNALYLSKQKKGVIVNISSIYGVVGNDQRIYGKGGINAPPSNAVSKAGIINLTRYLAAYWHKKNIRVNTLTLGGVKDESYQTKRFIKNYSEKTMLGRMASKIEYNGALLFLLSDASSYMTGSNLIVDGGWTAW